jgi:hypothetical protein
MPKSDTASVTVQLSLKSTLNTPPFNITDCQSTITDENGHKSTYCWSYPEAA